MLAGGFLLHTNRRPVHVELVHLYNGGSRLVRSINIVLYRVANTALNSFNYTIRSTDPAHSIVLLLCKNTVSQCRISSSLALDYALCSLHITPVFVSCFSLSSPAVLAVCSKSCSLKFVSFFLSCFSSGFLLFFSFYFLFFSSLQYALFRHL